MTTATPKSNADGSAVLPWRNDPDVLDAILDGGGRQVVYSVPRQIHRALIVKAVNAYDALKARAEQAEAALIATSAFIGDEAKDGEPLHETSARIVAQRNALVAACVVAQSGFLAMIDGDHECRSTFGEILEQLRAALALAKETP